MKETDSLNILESEEYVYVRERAAMERLIQRISAAERVAVDTEADSLHNYFEKVCLVQLSLGGAHYLVDPLCGLDLNRLLEALADKPLILHGGDYDLRMMRASMGFRARREVFDTMIAAQLLGFEQIGLAALIERYFDITIGKVGQKSDWSRRPLSENQLRYAVNDTRFLERLADRMHGELSARGRLAQGKLPGDGRIERTRSCTRTRKRLAHQGSRAADSPPTGLFARALALARPARPQREFAGLQSLGQSRDPGLGPMGGISPGRAAAPRT
jgi:ribonuclease D